MAKRLTALDGLRGIAALVVVVYHTLRLQDGFRAGIFRYEPDDALSTAMTITPLRSIFDGTVAVWIFFVLSGYVLSRRFWQGRRQSWGRYAVRRAVRLYLPLWGSAVIAVGCLGLRQFFEGATDGVIDLGAVGTSPAKVLTNLGLFGLTDAPVNAVWWSMRWEVWFSALLPLALGVLAVTGCGPRRRFSATPALFGLSCIVAVALQPAFIRAVELPLLLRDAGLYLPMFGVGVALAAFEDRIAGSTWWRRPARGWLVLVVALVLLGMRGPFGALRADGTMTVPFAAGAANASALVGAGMIVALFVGWPAGIRALSSRPVEWVGTRSYSLYLVHLPILHVLTAALAMHSAPVWFIALVVVVSVAASAVFYRLVEAPSIRLAARVSRGRADPPGPLRPSPGEQAIERTPTTVG